MSDTLRNAPPYVEGPSLFALARCLSHSRKVLSVPTLVNGKVSATDLDFTQSREEVEVDAIDHPVWTQKYTGTAQWTGGAAGLSGDFTGWVSDDDAAVPIKAEMKVILGSIHVELEQWDRAGWTPPVQMQTAHRLP